MSSYSPPSKANSFTSTATTSFSSFSSSPSMGHFSSSSSSSSSSLSSPRSLRVYCEDFLAYMVVHYRWIFVVLFLLPLSFFYNIFWTVRVALDEFRRRYFSSLSSLSHQQRVDRVVNQIKQWRADGCKTKLCTARPGWLTVSLRVGKYKDTLTKVDVSDMKQIIEINESEGFIRAEPGVSMAQVTKVLTPLGLTLAVVPELDDLTVGGLVNGFGVETSSFRFGLFQHICYEFEVVLPSGECIITSPTVRPEIYYAIPWSHGTIGFLVSAAIKIIPAKKYVLMEYFPAHSLDDITKLTEFHSRRIDDGNIDFVEALQYSLHKGVVMVAKMVDEAPSSCRDVKTNAIGNYYKPWFYTHVENFLQYSNMKYDEKYYAQYQHDGKGNYGQFKVTSPYRELIPLRDYYHRHSKSIFWEIQDIIPFGNHPIFRYTLGWLSPPKISLLKLTTTGTLKKLYTEQHVVQDILIPIVNLKQCIEICEKEFNVYPLWLCPMRILKQKEINGKGEGKTQENTNTLSQRHNASSSSSSSSSPSSSFSSTSTSHCTGTPMVHCLPNGDEMFIDVGAYGNPHVSTWSVVPSLRRVEHFVRSVGGYQALYADIYMTKEEFREMFNHTLYDQVRRATQSDLGFPEVFDKVSLQARK